MIEFINDLTHENIELRKEILSLRKGLNPLELKGYYFKRDGNFVIIDSDVFNDFIECINDYNEIVSRLKGIEDKLRGENND